MENILGLAEKEIINLKGQVNQLEGEKKSLEEDLTQAKQTPFKKLKREPSLDFPSPATWMNIFSRISLSKR